MPGILAAAIPAAIGAAGSIWDTITGAAQSRENTDKTIAANKAQAEYAYSKDLEMWNRGNAYNAPQAQMDRLKSAGLNPNLVYGSGSVAGQSAGQLPKYNAPTMDYSHNLPVQMGRGLQHIGEYQDTRIKQAQIDNMNAQRHAIYADTEIKKLEAIRRLSENQTLPEFLQTRNERAKWALGNDQVRQNILSQQAQQELFKTQKQPELFNTQMDALRGQIRNRQQEFEQRAGKFPLEQKARQQAIDYTSVKMSGARQQQVNLPRMWESQLLHNSFLNDKLVQDAESQRLQNETYYLRLMGTAGLNIAQAARGLKAPTKTPVRVNRGTIKDTPAMYQKRGYGNRK